MPPDEKVLGIVLKARAEMAEAARVVKESLADMDKQMAATSEGIKGKSESAFGKLASDAKTANVESTKAFAQAGSKTEDAFKKVSTSGRIAFQGIGSAAGQAGNALGPLTTGVNAMFASLASGGLIMVAVSAGLTGLGFLISQFTKQAREAKQVNDEFATSLEKTGTASLALYDKLAQVQDGLDQTQLRMREYQRQWGDGMIAVFNVTTGQWERVSGAIAKEMSGIGDNVNATHRTIEQIFRDTRGVAYYTNAIADLKAALKETSDEVMRGNLRAQIKALNDEMLALTTAPKATFKPLLIPPLVVAVDYKVNPFGEAESEQDKIMREAHDRLNADFAASDDRYAAKKQADRVNDVQNFYASTAVMQAAYGTFINSLSDSEMTGKQRREQIWKSFVSSSISEGGRLLMSVVAGEKLKQASFIQTAAVGIAATTAAIAKELAAAALAVIAWMKVAFAKLTAFFGFLGPFAPAAAAGVVGAAFGLMQSVVGAIKMQRGGIVPGFGAGDRVPALLEPGERVINREVYRANAPQIERAIQGNRGGNTINVYPERRMSIGDILDIERMIEDRIPAALERALDRGTLRTGLVFP